MNTQMPVFRITIKELVLELEDEQAVQLLGRSIGTLLGQATGAAGDEPLSVTGPGPKRRGRKPKAAPVAKGTRKRRPRSDAATAQIRKLRSEGYFATPRRASEVKGALAERGYDLENRQVYATLKYMADANDLVRTSESDDGVYRYGVATPEA